jgi:hypothetical protein
MDQRKPDAAANPFDRMDGYSGQDYHRDREAELARQHPGGEHLVEDGAPEQTQDRPGDTPEAGRAASIDPATGAVLGSGSGAGGGNPGEDHDDDATGGAGYPKTGVAGEAEVIAAKD